MSQTRRARFVPPATKRPSGDIATQNAYSSLGPRATTPSPLATFQSLTWPLAVASVSPSLENAIDWEPVAVVWPAAISRITSPLATSHKRTFPLPLAVAKVLLSGE